MRLKYRVCVLEMRLQLWVKYAFNSLAALSQEYCSGNVSALLVIDSQSPVSIDTVNGV